MGVGQVGRYLLPLAAVLLLCWPRLGQAQAQVEWQQGLLIASAAAPADLRSPNTELARVKANRVAEKRCYALLRAAAGELPTATGKKVKAVLGKALPAEGMGLITLASDQGSDGSVVVRMALPIDALRGRLFGPDTPLKPDPAVAASRAAVLVDARLLKLSPAIGLLLKSADQEYRGPVLFFKDESAARADARIGKDAILVVAKSLKKGALHMDMAKMAALMESRPLVAVLYTEAR